MLWYSRDSPLYVVCVTMKLLMQMAAPQTGTPSAGQWWPASYSQTQIDRVVVSLFYIIDTVTHPTRNGDFGSVYRGEFVSLAFDTPSR